MRLHPPHSSILLILFFLFVLLCGTGTAEPVSDISQISISSVTLTPEVYAPGDRGTVELTILNRGNTSIQLAAVTMTGAELKILSPSYTLVSPIGGGDTRTYFFDFIVPMEPGIYYPYISVNSARSGFFKYPVPIRVDATKPLITLSQIPSSFTSGRETAVEIQVANSRPDTIRNVQIIPLIHGEPAAEAIEIIPNQYFIGTLPSRETKTVNFTLTSTIEADLTFALHYQTGDNKHESEVTLPIRFSVNKKQADMALSSISFSTQSGVQQITGDITNVGLETAYSVTATIGEGANPVFPYRDYVLGTLNPDDFANFQLTFEPIGIRDTVTLIITFKDRDGNEYMQSFPFEQNGSASAFDGTLITSSSSSGGGGMRMNVGGGSMGGGGVRMTTGGGGGGGTRTFVGPAPMQGPGSAETVAPSDSLPLLPIAIVLLAIIGGAYYIRRNKQTNKQSKKMSRKGWKDLKLMKEIESYDQETDVQDSDQSTTSQTPDEK